VLESRQAGGGTALRRRRACSSCDKRFTTYERYERGPLFVCKRTGDRQPFDREKLLGGLLRAAHKRPVDPASMEALVDQIAAEAEAAGGELRTDRIGELALRGLRRLDPVAYIRFASVYNDFDDLDQFEAELHRLEAEPPFQSAALFQLDGDVTTRSIRSRSEDPEFAVQDRQRRGN
jgi:transcriptional repressor NrdR